MPQNARLVSTLPLFTCYNNGVRLLGHPNPQSSELLGALDFLDFSDALHSIKEGNRVLYFNTAFRVKLPSPDPQSRSCGISIGLCKNLRRYRHLLKLPPEFAKKAHLEARLYPELTVKRESKHGPLRIVNEDDDQVFMIITSRLTTNSGLVGNIRAPRNQEIKVIARGIAPKGTGQWETLVLKVKKGDAFYVNWNQLDGSDAVTGFYYVDDSGLVRSCPQIGIPGLFAELDVTPPFTVRDDPDPLVSRIDRREWQKL